jgi:hypothetical protein
MSCKIIRRTEDRIEGLGETRGQAPTNGGLCVHGRGDTSGQNASQASLFDQRTTIHGNCSDSFQLKNHFSHNCARN